MIICLDFCFHAILGILDYFQIYKQSHQLISEIPQNRIEVSLGISIFCALALVMVIPICYVQVTNLIQGKTTHERFARAREEVKDNLSSCSDSRSMLLRDTEDWLPENSRNSYGLKENEEIIESGCCYNAKNKKRERHMLPINDTQFSAVK